jgi:hypothetical protein
MRPCTHHNVFSKKSSIFLGNSASIRNTNSGPSQHTSDSIPLNRSAINPTEITAFRVSHRIHEQLHLLALSTVARETRSHFSPGRTGRRGSHQFHGTCSYRIKIALPSWDVRSSIRPVFESFRLAGPQTDGHNNAPQSRPKISPRELPHPATKNQCLQGERMFAY